MCRKTSPASAPSRPWCRKRTKSSASRDTNQAYANAFYEQARVNSLMAAWMPSLAAVCSVTILGYGGYLVTQGELTAGALIAFFMYVNMVVQPVRVAGFIISLFQRAAVASNRLFEVLNLAPEIADRPSEQTPRRRSTATSRYGICPSATRRSPPWCSITSDLHIRKGESLAIMGRVGSGKTTLLKLIVRLLDPAVGTIHVDGHDVHDYPLFQLRSQVAMVPQDPFLFGEPLGSNLTYDDPGRELDQIWAGRHSSGPCGNHRRVSRIDSTP